MLVTLVLNKRLCYGYSILPIRKEMSKARSARDAMRALNPTALVMTVTEPLTWDNGMELVRGNNWVVDTSNNPCTW